MSIVWMFSGPSQFCGLTWAVPRGMQTIFFFLLLDLQCPSEWQLEGVWLSQLPPTDLKDHQ